MMEIITIPIAELSQDPANVRQHPEANVEAIMGSLRRFGQQKPIVIDEKNVVRAGNGTLRAAIALGWTEIRCVRTGLAGSEATAYSIADNQSALTAEWSESALGETLRALAAEGMDMSVLGFGAGLDAILAQVADSPPIDVPQEIGEDVAGGVDAVTCPHCGREFPRP